ncbi:MAG: hypothetical protein ACK6C0_01880 [Betaproteobacteria bacterium]
MSIALLTPEQLHAQLRQWLPNVYQARDVHGELDRFLGLFAAHLARLRARTAQQYDDLFIESCQPWVIPYLADLVGTTVLYPQDDAARNRLDVLNTLRWRRAKGTAQAMAEMSAVIGGWGAHAAEMFERLVATVHLAHPQRPLVWTLDLRDGAALARAAQAAALSPARRLPDLRRGNAMGGGQQPGAVAVFTWPLAAAAREGVSPRALGGVRLTFDPLGHDLTLYAQHDADAQPAGADNCIAHTDALPLRNRDVAGHLAALLNRPAGFGLREDGIPLLAVDIAAAAPSTQPAPDYPLLAQAWGLRAADTSLFAAPRRFTVEARRLAMQLNPGINPPAPLAYSGGVAFASQLRLLGAIGRVACDPVTPDFSFTAGATPYDPITGDRAELLLVIRNTGAAAAAFPESEVIARNPDGRALLVFLPATAALAPAAELLLYVAEDGSSYYARTDHGAGAPDLNPDRSVYGAFKPAHRARAAEGQVRLAPGHPVGAGRRRRAVVRALCCWDKPLTPPLAAGTVAIDCERGRIAFPAGEVPAGALTVDFRAAAPSAATRGLGAQAGARDAALPLADADTRPILLRVARAQDADHASVQAALAAAPDNAAVPVVIEIADSATYEEALSLVNRSFPAGLVLRAAALATPTLVKPGAAAQLLQVTTSAIASVKFEGLACAGGALNLAAERIEFSNCTLWPASVAVNVSAAREVHLLRTIGGSLNVAAAGAVLRVVDSALQHPAATVEAPAGNAALAAPAATLWLEKSTVIGDVQAQRADFSNALVYGAVILADMAGSRARYSRLPRGFSVPQQFRCTPATPLFRTLAAHEPGYLLLMPRADRALTHGGENGGEIGVGYAAGYGMRAGKVQLRLDEFTPAGLTAHQVPVLPRLRFRGIR